MMAHLMQKGSLPWPLHGLSEQASFFLLSVCIRCALCLLTYALQAAAQPCLQPLGQPGTPGWHV